ncbi:MAG: ABC transporter substrate-binding protein [Gammaproteobacteria bacterium]|nr:ABC transporter substrate-binding protein [Gammaproteobacteria bacterium]MDD9896587.1 ABC transporter substrate-binding protein [Gammaproteobacteria bacterium]
MKSLKKFVMFLGFLLGSSGFLNAQQLSAVETAELGVETLLETVVSSKNFFLSDRERYFSEVENVLNTFVDFNAVAEVVMNRYAADATDGQKQRFADILKSTLTRFYGASLVNYNGEELVFLPSNDTDSDPRADTVVGMELRGSDSNLRLQYQMFLNENDEWKLKNLSLAGINLGRQYFTQFSALMTQHENDIDLVLDNWQ